VADGNGNQEIQNHRAGMSEKISGGFVGYACRKTELKASDTPNVLKREWFGWWSRPASRPEEIFLYGWMAGAPSRVTEFRLLGAGGS
jgi:hypothetical protein